jgi:hypothetical protein
MTDRAPAPRRPRLSKRALRAWAWIAGATAVFAPIGALAAQPTIYTERTVPRQVIVKKRLRRVIIVSHQQTSSPRIVYVGGGASTGGSAPPTTTGGSGVPR